MSERASEFIRVAAGPLEVEVVPTFGARLHRLRAFGHDLLRTPNDFRPYVDDPWFYGSYVMAPWCNRVPAGPAIAAGRAIDLPATFPDGTAIHGQVSGRAWEVVDADGDRASFRIEAGGDGWPWRYTVEQRVWIEGMKFRLSLRLTNDADTPMPGGIGIHPWFRQPVLVAIAAAAAHPSNLGTAAWPVPVTGILDRRRLEPLPEGLDATWTDLDEPPVVLDWPDLAISTTMSATALGGPVPFIVAANFPAAGAIAVEPQTHAPDGLGRLARGEPGALELVSPGESIELDVTLTFERTATGRVSTAQT